jgi:NADH-quinone oxidoreductase subunit E
MPLSEAAKREIRELMAKYPQPKSALMPALYIVQREYGYVPPEGMRELAEMFGLTPAQVASVATFYTMYDFKPVGQYVIDLCTNISCMLCGAYDIAEYIKQKLGIDFGETTPDGRFTLREVECIGACTGAPAMQINYRFYEKLTPEKVDEILDNLP